MKKLKASEADFARRYDEHKREVLERYFYDLKGLFLKRFEAFESRKTTHEHESRQLKELLEEILYVRSLLEEG